MTDKDNNNPSMGPQGTQVFEKNDINKMIADKIANAQSGTATTPALIGVSENVAGIQIILMKDKLEVGRRPTADIVLEDASVSSMHAQIIKQGDDWKVLNLLSSNGTFVNGEKVSEKFITSGDRIAFAGAEFVFTMVDEPVPTGKSSGGLGLILMALGLVAAFAGLFYFIL
ncbi:FHA domain-containing protein [Aliikangiella marina]|uniref:FHA domain-containing protein n=1 Tax=Aliikangiella marina TaxID=1712262 RepID=A0A545T789_9GAMM|nr:FHA domain-containing protein [Aliikangiella marina]TQV73058.1 FHA domain-containing protein [Aliikangiella marina]